MAALVDFAGDSTRGNGQNEEEGGEVAPTAHYTCLEWYPGGAAWQLGFSRREMRASGLRPLQRLLVDAAGKEYSEAQYEKALRWILFFPRNSLTTLQRRG